MSVRVALMRKLRQLLCLDEGLTLIPFKFQINGTTDPDNLEGDFLASMTRAAAGKFAGTLTDRPAFVFGGHAWLSSTADGVDLVGKVDTTTLVSAGTFTVRTMTGATETDPADDTYVAGVLLCKTTTRTRRKRP